MGADAQAVRHRCEQLGVSRQGRQQMMPHMYGAPGWVRSKEGGTEGALETCETRTEDTGGNRVSEREQACMRRCEQLGMSRQRRQQLMICTGDKRRWARSIIERMRSLDGERIPPHPSHSPETTPQRQTASALAQSENWETTERDGNRYISYTYGAHIDQRFHTAAVVFPGETEGVGLFVDREFQKGEYITRRGWERLWVKSVKQWRG